MRCLSFSTVAALLFLASACSGTSQHATTGATAAASGSGTTASGATASAGSSGSGSGTTGTSSSTGSSGSTSGGTSGGSTSGGAACGTNAVWTGSDCLLDACADANADQACLLVDGGKGTCIGTTCNGTDTLTDSSNCGGYGLSCPTSTSCVNGKCSGTSGTVTCEPGDCPVGQSCDSVNTSACGTDDCANASPGQRCEAPSGLGVCCGTTCSDIHSDSTNCGGCGTVCATGSACQNARCLADCTTASNNALCVSANALGFCCNGACETVTNDTANCGACGTSCPTAAACDNGGCTDSCGTANPCPTGFSCGTASGTCAATSCGGLADGTTCALTLANSQATAGVCCAGACLNAQADDHNCGGCGVTCGSGAQCVSGTCQPSVNCATAADNQACPLSNGVIGACCGGACVDLDSDTSACGQCGTACGAGDSCTGAIESTSALCQAPGGGSSSACSGPGAMAVCPTGTRCDPQYLDYCETTDCSGQPDRLPCEFPDGGGGSNAQCCAGQCNAVDDANNCGECGRACPTGATCATFGKCSVSCADGGACPAATFCSQLFGEEFCLSSDCSNKSNGMPCGFQPNNAGTCCNGTCTNESDSANCGGCGLACASGSLCLLGRCVASIPATTCAPACGDHQVCSPTGCVDSLCSASGSSCAAEDGAVGLCCSNGACVDLLSDPANCGACGLACGPAVACQQGLCLGSVCNADRHGAYCGTTASQICCGAACADVSSDSENCGACGRACAAGTTCTGGVCQ
jgi:hypothetical protein